AVKFLDWDQVDHTGNSVRAVQCRTTIQNDFQTADGDVRQQGSNGTVVDGTHAVDQCQAAVGAKAAQVEARSVGVLLTGLCGVDVSYCVGVLGVGKITNVLSHCRCTGLQQVFLADGVYGGGSGECTVTDIGSGDNNFFDVAVVVLGKCNSWHDQGRCQASMDHVSQSGAFLVVEHTLTLQV